MYRGLRGAVLPIVFLLVVGLTCGVLLPSPVAADEKASSDYLEKLPPILDRDLFFGDPEISGAQLSPDGKYISFRKPYKDVMNIWVKKTKRPFKTATPITADTERPVRGYFWTEDSRFILYVQDKGGNENYHIYAVDPAGEVDPKTGVPPARDLTPYDDVQARIFAVPENTPGEIVIGLNDRDQSVHDVYRLNLATGERKLVLENGANAIGYTTDLEGNVRLAVRTTDDGGTEILKVKGDELVPVLTCTFEETCGPVRFHKDGKRVYFISNRGEENDLTQLFLWDYESGEMELIEGDPEGKVDFGGPIFSDVTEELIGTYYVGDRVRIYPKTDDLASRLDFLRKNLPDGEILPGSSTEDERLALVRVTSDVDPGSVYLFDSKKMSVKKVYTSRPDLPSEHLAPMTPVRWKARDGQEIPGYLITPRGVEAKNLPTVILPHGGPWYRDTWGYDPFGQFLANRGYAALLPNFRGSTGYGKSFLNQGNDEWGTGIMQHDISDAVAWLVKEGIADKDRVAIMGGSYGGYATLAGLAFTPDLYAAGVSIVGPSNIITLLRSIPPYWGPVRKIFDVRVGNPDDPDDIERLKKQSPLYSANQIKAPLLVVQGANDPRVKQAESDQIVAVLRDLEREVEYIVAPDEGHGFAGRENRLAMMASIEKFLAKHLGGRYQEGMPDDIAEKLKTITVDVATVEMPELPKGLELAEAAPLPEVATEKLAPRNLKYGMLVKTMGQEMNVDATWELSPGERDGKPVWIVKVAAQAPMGEASDTFFLDGETLVPIHRSAKQGPAIIEIDYAADRVTGQIQAGPQQMKIDKELEAPVFGESGALDPVLLALPLEDGFSTTFRVFEVLMQRVRPMSLKVTGAETVEVPAGSFETLRVEVAPMDGEVGGGGTSWVATGDPRVIVKQEVQLPPMAGGGTITVSLQSIE